MNQILSGQSVRAGGKCLLIFSGLLQAWGQDGPPTLEITNKLSRSAGVPDGALQTGEPVIRLRGVVKAPSGIQRVIWESDRGVGGYATISGTRMALHLDWETELISLREGRNRIKVQALDFSNQAATSFVMIEYTPNDAQSPPQPVFRTSLYRGKPVTYEVRGGTAIYQGDIVLGSVDEMGPDAIAPPSRLSPRASTVANATSLWPASGGVVHVPYSGTINGNISAAISSFNATFSGFIQWIPRTSEANYVVWNLNASDTSGACESNVGMSGGAQNVGGSISCATSTLLHEMGHAIGLWHEQSRLDRNSYVSVIYSNVDKPQQSNFDQVLTNEVDLGAYNYASIMHYAANLFGKFGLSPTLESIPAGIPLSSILGYTAGDLDGIKRLYGAAPSSITIDSNPPGGQVIVDGVTVTTPKTFNWAPYSSHTLDLPVDPQTIGGQLCMFGRWNNLSGTTRTNSLTVIPGNNTVYAPSTSPAITVYTANFIPVYQYSLSAGTSNGTAVASPAPSLSYNGNNYYKNRQLISLTATPNSGFGFYEWYNISLYTLWANPNYIYVGNDLVNTQPGFMAAPILTVASSAPLFPSVGTFPSIAVKVDGGTYYTPQNFTWTSAHSLDGTPQNPSPVTTNISYAYGSWSDGLAKVHSVSPAGMNQTVTANYTPTYRSIIYTNPFTYSGCPFVVTPSADQSVAAGTMVSYNVTTIPGFSFAGWSGDFSGTANPFSTTVSDEVVATANFNLTGTTAPLAITSVSPSSVGATASAQALVITGTGFTNSTYAFWNNTFHAVTYNSSTSVTLHLAAGELSTAGYANIQLDNNSGNCTVGTNWTYPITISSQSPSLSITKMHSGNFTQGQQGTYTVVVSNANGSGSTSGTVTMTETVPTGMSIALMAGNNWICPPGGTTCTQTNPLVGGASYSAITVTVNVASNVAASVTNQVSVSGGGSAGAAASDVTTIIPVASQLKVTTQPLNGSTGIAISSVVVQVQDGGGSLVGSSSAAVTLTSNPAGINTTVNAVGGVATFSSLVFNSGGMYTLNATSTGLTPASSNSFTITAAVATPSVVIEAPVSNAVISSGTVVLTGWALDNTTAPGTAISSVQVKVDGTVIGNAAYGTNRPDVCTAYPNRPGCPNVGYIYSLSTALLSVGSHTITVTATDSDGSPDSGSASVSINVAPLSMTHTRVGVFRGGTAFLLDSNGNGIPDAPDRFLTTFTPPGGVLPTDIGVVGDWNGDGHSKAGYYRPTTGQWFLDANNNGILDAGDYTYGFGGVTGDVPVVGDWNGVAGVSGNKTCIGIFRQGFFWILDLNCNGSYDGIPMDAAFPFGGLAGDVPFVGNFAGGTARVGVIREYAPGGVPQGPPFFWVPDAGNANAGPLPANHQPDYPRTFGFGGLAGDQFVVGDWLGTGMSRAGVYRNGLWVLDANGLHNPDLTLTFGGVASDKPVTGNW